jgi:hypothetical protein
MKNLLALFPVGVLAVSLIFSSCSFFKNPSTPDVISVVVTPVVTLGVQKDPGIKPYLAAVASAINTFALGQDLSPAALSQAIETAKIKELETPEALAVATSVINLYKTYYNTAVANKLNSVPNLVPVLTAFSNAITSGLK